MIVISRPVWRGGLWVHWPQHPLRRALANRIRFVKRWEFPHLGFALMATRLRRKPVRPR